MKVPEGTQSELNHHSKKSIKSHMQLTYTALYPSLAGVFFVQLFSSGTMRSVLGFTISSRTRKTLQDRIWTPVLVQYMPTSTRFTNPTGSPFSKLGEVKCMITCLKGQSLSLWGAQGERCVVFCISKPVVLTMLISFRGQAGLSGFQQDNTF